MAALVLRPQVAAFLELVSSHGGPDLRFEEIEVAPGIHATFVDAGHILGSAIIRLRASDADDEPEIRSRPPFVPVVGEDGWPIEERGVSPTVPGLYFLGLLWQYTRGSALLGWVKDDAQFIAGRIDAFARRRATSRPDEPARTR